MKNLSHIVVWCPPLQDTRGGAVELQQPYQEEEEKIIGRFLFEEDRMKKKKEKKEILHRMWKAREKRLEELQEQQIQQRGREEHAILTPRQDIVRIHSVEDTVRDHQKKNKKIARGGTNPPPHVVTTWRMAEEAEDERESYRVMGHREQA